MSTSFSQIVRFKKIDKKARKFFWGHDSNNRKIHTICWEKITKPKFLMGLGIRLDVHQNKTLILELIWNIKNNPQKIWTKVLTCKYGSDILKRRTTKSYLFKSIQRCLPLYAAYIKNVIGDGNCTNIWYDTWLEEKLRSSLIEH